MKLMLILLLSAMGGSAQSIKVTLLGTGHPFPTIDRFGPSTLIEAGQEKLLIDCGRGVSQRLWQLGIPLSAPTAVFLTHLHSDHIVGLPDLWLTGWLPPLFGRRTAPFRIWGPRGTKEMMSYLEQAYQWDIRVRTEDEKLPPQGVAVIADDFGPHRTNVQNILGPVGGRRGFDVDRSRRNGRGTPRWT